MALWDGRFSGGPAEEMQAFSESLSTDMHMWEEDIQGSIAHATMLAEVGILKSAECDAIIEGLNTVANELRDGWQPSIAEEDIHMAVESRLHELIGAQAGKLHTGRSRNDQVATDLRLWLRRRIDELDAALQELIGALLDKTQSDGKTLVPGFTHLQRGQPIWLGHQFLAHAWALSRDRERLADAKKRVNRSPLGAAAMAGTPHPIDRTRSAELLNFDGLVDNAMDAVSARDHLLETVSTCAILGSHLSRMAEELILWSTREFGWIRLSDDWSTGSSIMPQKRNPDAAELIRGKVGRINGALVSLLTLVKALPLAYNRDLQEDRPPLFEAMFITTACTKVMRGCIESMQVNAGPDLHGDFALATELADYLVAKEVPFRQAHHIVGNLVKQCEDNGVNLAALSAEDLNTADPHFGADALDWLEPSAAAERRTSSGGTAWSEIEKQLSALRQSLGKT
ncbi:MAG: argininosuccinate lyase [Myxococcota bacterium]|nr:argininosuccinate lyase [Myxococcota bacterium]